MLAGSVVMAQPVDNMNALKPAKLKSFGRNAARIGDIYSAIDFFERYLELSPNDLKISFELALQIRKSRDYQTAKAAFKKIYDGAPEKFPLALFYYAQMQKMTGEYKEAQENFEKFRKAYKGGKDEQLYKTLQKAEVAGCEIAPAMMDSALDVLITHLDTSVNKAHVEFSPVSVSPTSMIYASLKSDKILYVASDSTEKMPVRKFYTAEKSGENWKSKGEWNSGMNLEGVQTGNGAFSPDGKRFYFTRCEKNFLDQVVCGIYVSKMNNGKWSAPEKLPKNINHPRFTSTQPTVGTEAKKGGEVLYFVSDRKGTKGGLDIWYAMYDARKGVFRDPKRAGSKINTIGDEMTPYFDMETRTLYFSSEGLPGMGGQDIFKAVGEKGKWSEPKNVGFPLNSSADDIYFVISRNREEGFFVSNREGGVALKNPTCCDDIYSYKWTKYIHVGLTGKIFEVEDTSSVNELESLISFRERAQKDTMKYDALKNAVVSLYLIDASSPEPIFVKSDTSGAKGNYFLMLEQGKKYRVVVERDNFFNRAFEFSTESIRRSDTLEWNAGIARIPPEPIVIRNIYYPFDKYYLTDSAKITIDTTIYPIMLDNPEIVAEISSHTDSRGTDKYNEKLSQKRAESVVNYLIEKGIAKDRLVAKGYGESKPLAKNEHEDGSDNPEGRAKNRRTEFKVIGRIKDVSDVIYEE